MQVSGAWGRGIRVLAIVGAAAGVLMAAPVFGQAPGNFAHDASQPINVSADRLEVREDGRSAVFSGNVEAVQGDLTLQASEVRVFYRPGGESDEFITRIDATGDVSITTPQETANGDWAIYDVDEEILTLGGNVRVKRGENTVQGRRLVLDLRSGRTQMEAGDDSGGGRVRGVFSPADSENGSDGQNTPEQTDSGQADSEQADPEQAASGQAGSNGAQQSE